MIRPDDSLIDSAANCFSVAVTLDDFFFFFAQSEFSLEKLRQEALRYSRPSVRIPESISAAE